MANYKDHVCDDCKNTVCIGNLMVLGNLPEEVQEEVMQSMQHRFFAKGEIIFHEGDSSRVIMLIQSGRIKIGRIDQNGDERILDILHQGEVIWDTLQEKQTVFPYSAAALTDVELCLIDRSTFVEIISKYPAAAVELVAGLGRRVAELNEIALLLSINNPVKRLSGFLLDRDLRCVGPEIHLKLEDIAAAVRLRPETVSRNLTKLEKMNLIRRTGRGRVLVTDRNGLQELFEELS